LDMWNRRFYEWMTRYAAYKEGFSMATVESAIGFGMIFGIVFMGGVSLAAMVHFYVMPFEDPGVMAVLWYGGIFHVILSFIITYRRFCIAKREMYIYGNYLALEASFGGKSVYAETMCLKDLVDIWMYFIFGARYMFWIIFGLGVCYHSLGKLIDFVDRDVRKKFRSFVTLDVEDISERDRQLKWNLEAESLGISYSDYVLSPEFEKRRISEKC